MQSQPQHSGTVPAPRIPQTPAAHAGRLLFTGILLLFIPLALAVLIAWFRHRRRT